MLMFSSNIPWNIPRLTCIFSLYTRAFSRVCIPTKYKWLVEYAMVYHEKGLHNYLIPRHSKNSGQQGTMERLGVVQLNCTDRCEGSVEYWWIYNSFPAFWLAVFSMARYRTKLITSCLIEMYKLSHNYYFNCSSWECVSLPNNSQGGATSCLLWFCSVINTEGLFSRTVAAHKHAISWKWINNMALH